MQVATALRFLAIAVYTVSLALPPFTTQESGFSDLGIIILLTGWFSVSEGLFAWLANPLFLFSVVRMKKNTKQSVFAALFACLTALDFSRVHSLGFDSGRDEYAQTVTGFNIGCYIWLSSMVIGLAAAMAQLYVSRDTKVEDTSP